MKVQILLPMSIAVTVVSFALMKIRVNDVAIEEKKATFQDVKLRVTTQVLSEYEKEMKNTDSLIEKEKNEQDELEKALNSINKDAKKGEVDSCTAMKNTILGEVASLEDNLKALQADMANKKTAWETEVAALQQKLNAPSPICNYIKRGSMMVLCPKKEEPKPEAPKPEEPKAEAPKPEEPKAEAPKPEEPKAEAPKP